MPNAESVMQPDHREDRPMSSDVANATMLSELCGALADEASTSAATPDREKALRGPYHIINANAVLVSSKTAKYRGRGGDNFILSPLFSGCRATGWKKTNPQVDTGLTLATAMAVSGAAINPDAGVGGEGVTRQPVLSVLMGLFNIRLGYWHANPNPDARKLGRLKWMHSFPWLLFRRRSTPNMIYPGLSESFGRGQLNEHEPFVLLTDGGHFENLGLYELVRRRLKLIVVVDGGADPDYTFGDLANAIEKVRADFGALIEISSAELNTLIPRRRESDSQDKDSLPCAERGYLVATIRYASRQVGTERGGSSEPAEETGTLLYLTTTFFKELKADLHGYRQTHPEFPDQPTADQFLDEKQFEAYRELGYQTAMQAIGQLSAQTSWTVSVSFD